MKNMLHVLIALNLFLLLTLFLRKNHRFRRLLYLLRHPRFLWLRLRNFLQVVLLILTRL